MCWALGRHEFVLVIFSITILLTGTFSLLPETVAQTNKKVDLDSFDRSQILFDKEQITWGRAAYEVNKTQI